MADACECGNEPSGSVKCGEFLDYYYVSLEFGLVPVFTRTPLQFVADLPLRFCNIAWIIGLLQLH